MTTVVRQKVEVFMSKHAYLFRGKRLLDVGSGKPAKYRGFVWGEYVPIDKEFDGIDICIEIPFTGQCALCISVLEHVIDPVSVIKNIRKAIGTGYLIVSVPMVYEIHDPVSDFYRFTENFGGLLSRLGFEVMDQEIQSGEGRFLITLLCKGI